jgi:hypothetical protein
MGEEAGTLHPAGYRKISVLNHTFSAHRLVWLYVYGEWPTGEIDHINGVKHDNRLANLRDVSISVNRQNRRRATPGSASGVLGIAQTSSGKWSASIRYDGRRSYLGSFVSQQEAHQAYLAAKRQHHPGCTI